MDDWLAELAAYVACCKEICHACSCAHDPPQGAFWKKCGLSALGYQHFACAPIRKLIAEWHAKYDPKPCHHTTPRLKADTIADETILYYCPDCNATRRRGWIGEWEPAK